MRPANGVPGECYTLEDRLDDAMESEDDDQDGVHDEEDEDEIDPDDGKPVKLGQIKNLVQSRGGRSTRAKISEAEKVTEIQIQFL